MSRLILRAPVLRPSVVPVHTFGPSSSYRFKSETSPSSSDATYGHPQGSSSASSQTSNTINANRATEGAGIENTGIAQPVSSSDSTTGMSEEEQPGVGDIHQPADKPAGEKAAQTLKQGEKKLDAAD